MLRNILSLSFILILFLSCQSTDTNTEAESPEQLNESRESSADALQDSGDVSTGSPDVLSLPETAEVQIAEENDEPSSELVGTILEDDSVVSLTEEEELSKSASLRGGSKRRSIPIEKIESEAEALPVDSIVLGETPASDEIVIVEEIVIEEKGDAEKSLSAGPVKEEPAELAYIGNPTLVSEAEGMGPNPLLDPIDDAPVPASSPVVDMSNSPKNVDDNPSMDSRRVLTMPETVLPRETLREEAPVGIVKPESDASELLEQAGISSEPEAVSEELAVSEEMNRIEEGEYELHLDAGGKVVLIFEGAGWVLLSVEDNRLKLSDKSYMPGEGRTSFSFTLEKGDEAVVQLVFLKQDLLVGESMTRTMDLDLEGLQKPQEDPSDTETAEDSVLYMAEVPDEAAPEDQHQSVSILPDTQVASTEDIADSSIAVENSADTDPSGTELVPDHFMDMNARELLEAARRFEAPGEGQSLEKALELYEMIREKFPVTEERFEAENRIRYLNKYYFKVQ